MIPSEIASDRERKLNAQAFPNIKQATVPNIY